MIGLHAIFALILQILVMIIILNLGSLNVLVIAQIASQMYGKDNSNIEYIKMCTLSSLFYYVDQMFCCDFEICHLNS